MTLDLALLGLVLLAAVAGALSGALRQVLKLAGVVAGWAAARWLAPRLTQELHAPSPATRVAVIAGTFVVGWLLAALLARGHPARPCRGTRSGQAGSTGCWAPCWARPRGCWWPGSSSRC